MRVVVLVSGTGSLLQALLNASVDPDYGVQVVAVGADRAGIEALARAERSGVPTFIERVGDYPNRQLWDAALAARVAQFQPDLVISAGFLKLVGHDFLVAFGDRFINTHPSLLPAFPGAHPVRDALAYGNTVTGATVFFVDAGTDTGPIIEQRAVSIQPQDTEASLHERIKQVEREMLVEVVGRLARQSWTITGRNVTLR
ncbi:MAG: phosphoribosylglycinamide formyltransferase [Acidimicrobiales bacterium]|nr:MAG: phosphoribosylglycinamide formyltransferase [Acidimicrobiales bacterium]